MDRPWRGGRWGWRKEAQETRDLSDGLREKFSNCQRTTTSETDKFSGGFRRLRYPTPSLPLPPVPNCHPLVPSPWPVIGTGVQKRGKIPVEVPFIPASISQVIL